MGMVLENVLSSPLLFVLYINDIIEDLEYVVLVIRYACIGLSIGLCAC